jgi:hypothetical protein
MNFKTLATLAAILSLVNSLFYLIAPAFSLSLLGQTAAPIGLLNTRVAGAIALGIAAINWLSRNIREISHQQIVIRSNLIMFTVLTVVEIEGTLSSTLNWIGWLFIIADSLFAVGFARLLKKF